MVSMSNDKFAEKEYSPTFVKICFTDLSLQECCGRGSFGTVYRAHWISQDKCVAVKVLSHLGEEVSILSTLSHRNIIKFYGACCVSPNYCIVSEYAPHGSLYCFLSSPAGLELRFSQMLCWARDVALGMNYLHEEAPIQVIHRDLKSKNILIGKESCLKICDFGASRTFDETTVMTSTGTYPWMAPELIQGLPTSQLCDVYSFGIVLWELVTREMPFDGLQGFQVAWNVVENHERPIIPSSCPQHLSNIIQRCWQGDPSFRPAFSEILSLLSDMLVDDVLEKETNEFTLAKPVWVAEVDDGIMTIKKAETKIKNEKDAANSRDALMKLWSERMNNELMRHSLFGYSYQTTFSRSVSRNYVDENELSVGLKNDTLMTRPGDHSMRNGDLMSFERVKSSSSLESMQQSSSFASNVCQFTRERCETDTAATENSAVAVHEGSRTKIKLKKQSSVGGTKFEELSDKVVNSSATISCGGVDTLHSEERGSGSGHGSSPSVGSIAEKIAKVITADLVHEALKRISLPLSQRNLLQLSTALSTNLVSLMHSSGIIRSDHQELEPSNLLMPPSQSLDLPMHRSRNSDDVTTQTPSIKMNETATQTPTALSSQDTRVRNKLKPQMMKVRSEDDASGFFSHQIRDIEGKISNVSVDREYQAVRSAFELEMTPSMGHGDSFTAKTIKSFQKKQSLSDSGFHDFSM